jgi:hypothetical protein
MQQVQWIPAIFRCVLCCFLGVIWLFVCQVAVQASSLVVMDAVTDNPGTWLFHCHLTDHIHGGMMALFRITGTAPAQQLKGKVGGGGGGDQPGHHPSSCTGLITIMSRQFMLLSMPVRDRICEGP